ncbi:hypothetical protein K469DRAFT_686630 [Zopfia rhizophila CBS 207.26]|uniref:Uncharacterized protein n=1 Tax=Zopfia rhizophila CBS 207.26 TaxID=1314779 RepID=A0A6A6ER32_9PEZI|nr:hypothetical protein K469DRAFT_686630 [Zopfia rhizophila CBS 207.26]
MGAGVAWLDEDGQWDSLDFMVGWEFLNVLALDCLYDRAQLFKGMGVDISLGRVKGYGESVGNWMVHEVADRGRCGPGTNVGGYHNGKPVVLPAILGWAGRDVEKEWLFGASHD